MRKIKNYKHFRKEPSIWGMNVKAFMVFIIIVICSLMSLTTGVTIPKLIVILLIIGVSYLICVSLLSNRGLFSSLSDEKLPKKISKYE
ncbi:hypothetical protein QW060_23845 [Myroides ceti]|uniref:Uncharacterized protein n=1 Tax=Paenimyroides ceti TaxID=395087 RepID=A0ABT8CZC6_9FLAO|nr:hypothetical protein [Paenimyroides ceti]MDN3709938.1 hypothetical protein [Paenimyroides ceti]